MMKSLKRLLRPSYLRLRRLASALSPGRLAATFRFFVGLLDTLGRRRRESRLTVAVDISSFWEPLTGIGWYLYRLLEHLAEREDLQLRLYGPLMVRGEGYPEPVVEPPAGSSIERISYAVPKRLSVPSWMVERLLQKARPLLIAADGNRIVFAPNYLIPRAFRLCRGRLVATVHDLGFVRVPQTLQEETLSQLSRGMEHTFRRARHLVTPSRAVAQEIVEAGFAPKDRITAIHHGPGQLAQTEPGSLAEGIPHPFALFVGTVEPRKNLSTALAAWRILRGQGIEPPPLVLCGKLGWKSELIQPELEEAARQGWLIHLGYVDNPTLAALYQGASVVVFPSLYEGFGLPAVEAQQAGAPLICSDLPVFREVAGEGALYAPAEDPEAWAKALGRLLEEPELGPRLTRLGRESACRFSWEKAAASTWEVWKKAAGGS